MRVLDPPQPGEAFGSRLRSSLISPQMDLLGQAVTQSVSWLFFRVKLSFVLSFAVPHEENGNLLFPSVPEFLHLMVPTVRVFSPSTAAEASSSFPPRLARFP